MTTLTHTHAHRAAPILLGSPTASMRSHQAFHRAMKNIFRKRQLGEGPRFNREHDKPAMLGTQRSASETPADAREEARFEVELRDSLSTYSLVVAAGIALLVCASYCIYSMLA